MSEINDIDDIIEEDLDKEKPIDENYQVKKSTFRMDLKLNSFLTEKKYLLC